MSREALVSQLIQVGREMYDRGWMLATGGNLSARDGDRIFMSASGGHKGKLTTSDFLDMHRDGTLATPTDRKSSAETVVHLALYEALNPGAIVHVHGPYMTLVSRQRLGDGGVTLERWEFIKALGYWDENAVAVMPVVENHHDLDALAKAVTAAATECPAVLVAGHGVYAWGDTVADAQRHVEATEFLCRMTWEWAR